MSAPEWEANRHPIEPLATDERRFLLRAIEALAAVQACGVLDDDDEALREHLTDQLRWVISPPWAPAEQYDVAERQVHPR